ncbi:glycerophosphoryl diester phosphodiesterase membrane domain-containing protein [Allosphingosinicella flava]|uniref:Glycerophosphoryl diester phosphodiesterase membrane domain-containing protein n=1 Tax=Allosphingosinicella flava TaxID=2771430 RepID=A0A7T2GLI1_9SPHN|nr:glycerophosphoryl diester phosphodiesterase membrane domain-containing protein [Sphingosinicella flava]QPQ55982.1 glycerophosphoryl diester phosphodiesterase membrane domain-containing protein [Sphingosinicella flava]
MKPLSISAAWNETAAFVKREAGLLFPIALAFLALPSIVVQFFMPEAAPGQQPELGAWMFLLLPLILLTLIGSLAITALALRPAQSVQEAIGHGMRRILPVLGAAFLLGLGSFTIALPASILIALLGLAERTTTILMVLLFLAILTFLWIRFILLTPAAVAEPLGPVALLKRSWNLTRGHFSKLIGFITVLTIVALIILIAVSLIFGTVIALLFGAPEPRNLSYVLTLIVSGVASAVFSVYITVAIARIYAQLAEGSTSGI